MNYMLKKNGIVLIDDLQLYSCNQLSQFLHYERDFELVLDLGKLKAYRKTSNRRIIAGNKSGLNLAMKGKF